MVADATGDLSIFITPNVTTGTFFAPWNFHTVSPIPTFWSAGGFNFELTQSAIVSQGGSPARVVVTGRGFISGHGYDLTPGGWNFSTQDPSTGNPARFSFSAGAAATRCDLTEGFNDINDVASERVGHAEQQSAVVVGKHGLVPRQFHNISVSIGCPRLLYWRRL